MSDSEEINELKRQIAEMREVYGNEIAFLRAKWDSFERDMMRISRNPNLIAQQVQQQMRAHGIRPPLRQR